MHTWRRRGTRWANYTPAGKKLAQAALPATRRRQCLKHPRGKARRRGRLNNALKPIEQLAQFAELVSRGGIVLQQPLEAGRLVGRRGTVEHRVHQSTSFELVHGPNPA
jgi:hypothetical protein